MGALIDPDAVRNEMIQFGIDLKMEDAHPEIGASEVVDRRVDAVVDMARPMPTARQIDLVLAKHKVAAFCGTDTACSCDRTWRPNVAYREHVRDAVLALLNGTES